MFKEEQVIDGSTNYLYKLNRFLSSLCHCSFLLKQFYVNVHRPKTGNVRFVGEAFSLEASHPHNKWDRRGVVGAGGGDADRYAANDAYH